jgi:transcriptional regulator with XRE-family HTH domain
LSLKELGVFVRQLREERGWSQENLALTALVDDAYIGRLENGKQIGSATSLIAIALALGVRPGILLDKLAGVENAEDVLLKRTGRWLKLPEGLGNEEEAILEKLAQMLVKNYSTTTGHQAEPSKEI